MDVKKIFQQTAIVRDELTVRQKKEIRKLYSQWAGEVNNMANYYKTKTYPSAKLQEKQLKLLVQELEKQSKAVTIEIEKKIKENIFIVSESVLQANNQWMRSLGFSTSKVSAAFTSVNDYIVRSLTTGSIYKDGWSLSQAIWSDNDKALKDIYNVVASGVAKNQSIYEISKNLESYVDPAKKKLWNLTAKDGVRIYKKSVDYNAQRLARTLVQHGYQQSFVAVTQPNPLITEYKWLSNGSRVCEICKARDGTIYKKDELPLDHPNGMCTMIPVLESGYIDRLANWFNNDAGTDPALDNFAKMFGYK